MDVGHTSGPSFADALSNHSTMSTAAAAQLIANHDARVKFLATMWEGGLDTTEDMAGQVSSLMAAISLEGDLDVQSASEVGRAFNQGP